MHHLRFNIAGALCSIWFVAVGFAALREADELWDSWIFSLTCGLLLVAVLLAPHRTGACRAFWVGFALFGWGYLSLSLIPSTEPRLITTKALSHLYQSKIFGIRAYKMRFILLPDRMQVHNVSPQDIMCALMPSTFAGSPMHLVTKTWQSKEYELTHTGLYSKPEQFENIVLRASPEGEILRLKEVAKIEMDSSVYIPRVGARTDENFIHVGHSLFALLAAWLGGVFSRRLSRVSVTPEVPREGE